MFDCDHFIEVYIYGRNTVYVETDDKPLVSIMLKSLNRASSRLQRMFFKSQKDNLNVKYKQGNHMFVADTFIHTHLPTVNTCEFVYNLEEIDHTISLSLSPDQVKLASMDDAVLQQLHETIKKG